MMKGGGGGSFHGLRGKQTSLILIALICTSIFIWAWDNSNLLTTLVPHQDHLLVNPPETTVVDIPKQDISLREDIENVVIPEEKTRTEQTEQSSNFVASIDSNSESTSKESIDDENNNIGSSLEKKDISSKEDVSNDIAEGESITEQAKMSSVDSFGSETRNTSEASNEDVEEDSVASIEKKGSGGTPTEQVEKSSNAKSIGSGSEGNRETSLDDGKSESSSTKNDSFGSETSNNPETSNEGGEEDSVVSVDKKEGGTTTGQVEKSPKVKPIGSGLEGNRETSLDDGKSVSSSTKNDEIMMVVAVNTTKPKQNLEGEKPDIPKKVFDFVTPEANNPEGKVDSLVDGPVRKKEACNYAKGKWIEDSKRPLYSGFGCKQWLSDMWACRLTQRTDFAYETFRWKPFNCEMPDFEASSFLKRMQHKTIAIIGDSLGRQQFQSLMCMATGGQDRPDVINVGWEYELRKPRGAVRPDGWAYRFPSTNTTILYYWSASLCDLEPINISDKNTDWAMHLDRPPAFLRRYLDRFDVLVLNTGHHWNRGKLNANRWVMHIGGVPNTDRKLAEIGRAKNFTIYSIANWVNLQLPKHPRLKAFFRTISPRHFFNGDWNTGGSCDNTTPLAGGKEVTQNESLDPSVAGAVNGTGVKLLDITAISQLRDEGHISRYSIRATPGMQDCLHWCLPGIPDTWNELLIAQL